MSKSAISQALQKQTNTKSIFALTVAKFSLQINFCPIIPAAAALRSPPCRGSCADCDPEGLCEPPPANPTLLCPRGDTQHPPIARREIFSPSPDVKHLFLPVPRRGNAAGLTPSSTRQTHVEPGDRSVPYLGFISGLEDYSPLPPLRGSVATPWSSWMRPRQSILSLLAAAFPSRSGGKGRSEAGEGKPPPVRWQSGE